MIATLARRAKRAAEAVNERRVLVLAGDRDTGIDAAYTAVEAALGATEDDVSVVSTREGFRFEEHRPRRADGLLGRTREAVVLDCHEQFVPNALGRCVGAVDGGGLLILVAPALDAWPATRDRFDESLAVPPYALDDVAGRFRERLVDTLRTHSGIAIVSLGDGPEGRNALSRDALSADSVGGGETVSETQPPTAPPDATFPTAAYEACLTADQARAVRAFEPLSTPGNAVVVEADRGRGKSSAAGLAAGALALSGADVLVTAPAAQNAAAVFARARELVSRDGTDDTESSATAAAEATRNLDVPGGGRVRYLPPAEASEMPGRPDVVIVDEAAALPVRLLDRLLDAPSIAFCTTVHGYEGSGRGFAIRFRERLLASRLAVRDVRLDEPIRYARDDPIEAWASHALLLDARPAVEEAVAGAAVADATYRPLDPTELVADETLLGEAFGLLVAAHYRTEPNDLARLLDAPNLLARALVADGRVVAVALLAREGGLDAATRSEMYEGERVRGNMVPDLLTSQLRDEAAAEPRGIRTVRIATHAALRDEGFGSRLLSEIHAEFGSTGGAFEGTDAGVESTDAEFGSTDAAGDGVDYFSVGYGATPRLLRFWRRAGYRTVHLSTVRNDTSGEHSAVMLRPAGEAGAALLDRHADAFRDRERDGLSDAHREVDADVIRGALRACAAPVPIDLTDAEWRSVVGASFGPGTYDTAPGAFRDLALAALIEGDGADDAALDDREERLLVQKVLQGRKAASVADDLGFVSTAACMRALGDAYVPLVERYGTELALAERERFTTE
ncbi:tRNA(Met) cytidine acetyltransferase TmcA [Halorubrum sp. BV1]|uniref:tRNA(Met) cytidine acetyltransferase TmcA n=1 Tax=Halorubrum sp. BV1 TaxID=1498500 RepID=UPI000678E1D8|nr:tRNA(Met) cytidine acetyltransferase TmcA [Halorubrum sp. BV1]